MREPDGDVSGDPTVRVLADVYVPRPPNFLRVEGGCSVPVASFSNEDLELIGREWTKRLIERAREQRAAAEDG